MTYEEKVTRLLELIPEEEKNRVFKQEMCEICSDFIGFIDTYYELSKLIPKDWAIIDFGCGYNPQCYYFSEHKEYIAVQPIDDCTPTELFQSDNCTIYRMTSGQFIKKIMPKLKLNISKVFAIANYVPKWYGESTVNLVLRNFKNVYTFYPSPCEEDIL